MSGIMLVRLKLEASMLRDPTLVNELFSRLLLPVDVNKLLSISWREIRRRAVDYLIRIFIDFLI